VTHEWGACRNLVPLPGAPSGCLVQCGRPGVGSAVVPEVGWICDQCVDARLDALSALSSESALSGQKGLP
jgi:hypothetical protein